MTSSIASVSSASHHGGTIQLVQDFQAIGTALQTGDLTSAQSALASFQQALQSTSQTSATQPFGKNTQANTDYQNLTGDLQSGDLSGAQQAFSSLQHDLLPTQSPQSVELAHHGHHHHHHAFATAANSTLGSSASSLADGISVGGLNLLG